jgi:hypothetical protein
MGLFGNKAQKQMEEAAAAKEEADRLAGLPVAEIAAEILAAFGPDGPGKNATKSIGTFQIGLWLMRDFPRGNQYMKELLAPIREGTQALEHAELVEIRATNNGGVAERAMATRLGLATIEDGSAAEKLAARTGA